VALGHLNRALELDPNFAKAYSLRAHIHYLRRNYPGALEDADRTIALEPHLGAHYYNRGYFREFLKDYGGALSDFRRARELAIEQEDDDLVDATDHHIPDLERWLTGIE